jgi:hypothetical protein
MPKQKLSSTGIAVTDDHRKPGPATGSRSSVVNLCISAVSYTRHRRRRLQIADVAVGIHSGINSHVRFAVLLRSLQATVSETASQSTPLRRRDGLRRVGTADPATGHRPVVPITAQPNEMNRLAATRERRERCMLLNDAAINSGRLTVLLHAVVPKVATRRRVIYRHLTGKAKR